MYLIRYYFIFDRQLTSIVSLLLKRNQRFTENNIILIYINVINLFMYKLVRNGMNKNIIRMSLKNPHNII